MMLIHDEPTVLQVDQKYLDKLGVKVYNCNSEKIALDLLQKIHSTIDAIIIDLIMPEMDGYTLFKEIQRLYPELAIFISIRYSKYDINDKFKSSTIPVLSKNLIL